MRDKLLKVLVGVVLACLTASSVLATETESQKLYRLEIENEIKRHHELQMVEKQIEVLARLEMLGASNISVSQGTSVKMINKNQNKEVKK
jgi:hypothetical protein